MNKLTRNISVGALLMTGVLTACNDLDTMPYDSYVTAKESEEVIADRGEMAYAGVVGVCANYSQYEKVYSSHIDFGWPSVLMQLDAIGPDFVSYDTGYNWMAFSGDYALGSANNYLNNMAWYYAYKVIKSCNDMLAGLDLESEDPSVLINAAQGLSNRAYCYFILAQLFQYTYVGHESLPCVPLILPENADEAANNGLKRSTVQEVYDQILKDLDMSIEFLTYCNQNKVTTANIADVSDGVKRFISLGTAYGLRARVNLVMNNWQAAASDAAYAISTSKATPYSWAQSAQPCLNSGDDANIMWIIYVAETDRVVTSGIVNWPSMMGTFNTNGYAAAGAFRMINESLYSSIPSTDSRKGWWLNSNGLSQNLTAEQQAYISNKVDPDPLTQVKFAPYKNQMGTTTHATPYPLMRVEEMYLIQAEATAMAGNAAEGKNLLETFVKNYRDPGYMTEGASAEEVQEAVWMQRRIEFWGEGMCYFDLLRLNKGLDRRGGGYESQWVYNVPAPLKPFVIPTQEVEVNKALGANNETWSQPQPVADI